MTVESKIEETQTAEIAVSQEQKPSKGVQEKGGEIEAMEVAKENGESKNGGEPKAGEVVEGKEIEGKHKTGEVMEERKIEAESVYHSLAALVEKSSSFREESNLLSDLKENEKAALIELKSKLEEAILGNQLFKVKKEQEEELEKAKHSEGEAEKIEKPGQESEDKEKLEAEEEEKPVKEEAEQKKKGSQEGEKENAQVVIEKNTAEVDRDIALWRVSLLPSEGDKGIDVVLLKFLRAREFKVNEAFEMLRKTLQWRKENNIDSILDEDFGADLGSVAYMNGVDREGHPVCYNVYGVFGNDEIYNKTFGTEEKREKFLRWRFQLMEKGIQKLDFKPGGVSSLLQINDLKNTPGPSKKELRLATKQAVDLLQDNYPEFVARNIFINVPFWYYAFNALLSPFLTQRTKSKFVFARPASVTETLLKYIAAEEIPVHYGGLKRENDSEFSTEDGVTEVIIKAGSTEAIEIPTPEVGTTSVWDLTVLGWDVNYKEEFVPTDEGSYTIIIQKGKKMGWQEGPIRNSFKNNEPGKIVLTIENGLFKKKRVLYRYKAKSSCSSS